MYSFSRGREARIGKNRKGGRSLILDRLRTIRLAMAKADGAVELVTEKNIIGPAEVMVQRARTATGPLSFGRPSTRWQMSEVAGDQAHAAEPQAPAPPSSPAPPSRPPSLRGHLLACTRHVCPALVASMRATGPPGGIMSIRATRVTTAAACPTARWRPGSWGEYPAERVGYTESRKSFSCAPAMEFLVACGEIVQPGEFPRLHGERFLMAAPPWQAPAGALSCCDGSLE